MLAVAGCLCVVVLLYCLCVVVLCCLIIETCKAVVLCCVVVCKDNSKVERCRNNGVINRAVNRVVNSFVSVDNFVDGVVDGWEVRERSHEFYPVKKSHFTMEF